MGRQRTKAADRKASQQRHQPPTGLERRANRVEAFFARNISVAPYTPEEQGETDVAQVQVILEGQPAYNLRAEAKLYTTFLLPQVALGLADALTTHGTALADRGIEGHELPSGLQIPGPGANIAAMAEQLQAVDDLRA